MECRLQVVEDKQKEAISDKELEDCLSRVKNLIIQNLAESTEEDPNERNKTDIKKLQHLCIDY